MKYRYLISLSGSIVISLSAEQVQTTDGRCLNLNPDMTYSFYACPEVHGDEQQDSINTPSHEFKAASAELLSLLGPALKHVYDPFELTELQRQQKEEQIKKALYAINHSQRGRKLIIQQLKVQDVREDTEINAKGNAYAATLLAKLRSTPEGRLQWPPGDGWKKDPLLRFTMGIMMIGCKDCTSPTGKYRIRFEMERSTGMAYISPTKQYPAIEVTKMVKSKTEALGYSRDKIYTIEGAVEVIVLENSGPKVKLLLQ